MCFSSTIGSTDLKPTYIHLITIKLAICVVPENSKNSPTLPLVDQTPEILYLSLNKLLTVTLQ